MTIIEDLIATVVVQCGAFAVLCFAAWKHGRPINMNCRLVLKWTPLFCIAMFVVCVIGVLGESKGYAIRHAWMHMRDAADSLLWLTAGLLGIAFRRIGPWLLDDGAKRHPRPIIKRSVTEIHARRRANRAAEIAALPFVALGIGAFGICAYFAIQAKDGELFVFGFLGMVVWTYSVLIVSIIWARRKSACNDAETH